MRFHPRTGASSASPLLAALAIAAVAILGAGMLVLAINVYMRRERSQSLRATRKLFAFSILYLFALFATLLVEVVFRALVAMVGGA